MKRRSEAGMDWDQLREQIIGLDGQVVRKSYYPELQRRLAELEKFRALLDQSSDAIFLLRCPGGELDDVNEAACRRLGYSRSELLELPVSAWLDGAPSFDLSAWLSGGPEPGGTVTVVTACLRCRDGQRFPAEISIRRATFEYQDYLMLLARDITQRQQAQRALEESEARYRALFEQAQDAIFLETEDDEIVDVNQQACRLLGYSREELLQLKVGDLIAPEARRSTRQVIRDELARYAGRPFESINRHRDGHLIPVEVVVTRLMAQEKPLVLAIVRDITERKRAAEAIRQLSEFNESIIQNIAEGIMVEDANGYITFVNPAAAAMLGYPADQLIGMHRSMFIPAEQWPLVAAYLDQGVQTREVRYQLELLRQDRGRLPVQVSSRALWQEGQFKGLLSVLTNMEEQARAEAEKNRLLARMEQQRATLLQLSTHPALVTGRLEEIFALVSRLAALTLQVARVTVWQFDESGEWLVCRGYWQLPELPRPDEQPLLASRYPLYIAALRSGLVLETSDVFTDPRTAELSAEYWQPLGITSTVEAPIWLRGQVVGVICHEHIGPPRTWMPDEVTFTMQVAALVSQGLLNAALQQQTTELVTLTRIGQEIMALHELPEILGMIAAQAAALLHCDAGGVFLRQEDGSLRTMAGYGVGEPFLQALRQQPVWPGQGAVGLACMQRAPVQYADVLALPGYEFKALAQLEQIHAILAVPMLQSSESPSGGLVVWHRQPRRFTAQEVNLLQALAQQCVNAVENARLIASERTSRVQAEALYRASRAMGTAVSPLALLNSLKELADWLDFSLALLLHFTALEQEQQPRAGMLYLLQQTGEGWRAEALGGSATLLNALPPSWLQEPDAILSTVGLGIVGAYLPADWMAALPSQDLQATLTVPLNLHGRPVGLLVFASTTPAYQFPTSAGRWLRAMADQLAVALENQRLLVETQQTASRMKMLYETSRALSSSLEEENLIVTILQAAYKTLGFEYVLVATVDPLARTINHRHLIWQGQLDAFPLWLQQGRYPLDHPNILAEIYRTGRPAILEQWDERCDPVLWEQFNQERFVRLFTPVRMGERVLGVIEAGHDKQKRDRVDLAEVQLLTALADQMAVALENARLFASLVRETRRLDLLYGITRQLANATTLAEVAAVAVQAAPAVGAEYADLILLEGAEPSFYHSTVPGRAQLTLEQAREFVTLLIQQGLQGWVVREQQSALVYDTQSDARWFQIKNFQASRLIRSAIGVPLLDRQGACRGVLTYHHTQSHAFDVEEQRLAEEIAARVGVALENVRLLEQTRRQAREQEAVGQVAGALNALPLTAAFPTVETALRSLTGADWCGLALGEEATGWQVFSPRPDLNEALAVALPECNHETVFLSVDLNEHDLPGTEALRAAGFRSCLKLALLLGEQKIGFLLLASCRPAHFSPAQVPILQQIAAAIASAVERERLFQAEQRRRQEAETLRATALALSADLNRVQVIEQILAQLQTVVPYDSASVQLLKGDRLEIVGGRGFPNLPELLGLTFPLDGQYPNREVVLQRRPFRVADGPARYLTFRQEPHVQANIRSWLGVPMSIGERLIGMIALDKHEPDFYTPDHARLAEAFAAQAAIAIHNSQLFTEIQQRAEELAALHESAVALASALDVEAVLYTLAQRMGTVVDVTSVYICDWNPQDHSSRVLVEWWGAAAHEKERQSSLGMVYDMRDFPETYQVLQTGRYQVLRADDPYLSLAEQRESQRYGWRSSLLIPLVIRDVAVGYAELWESRRLRDFTPNEIQLCQTLAADAAVALEHARLFQAEREQRRLAEALAEAAAVVTSSLDKTVVVESILQQVARVVPGQAVQLLQVDEEQVARVVGYHSFREPTLENVLQYAMPVAAYHNLATMARTGEPYLIPDTAADPEWQVIAGTEWVRSQVAAPVQVLGKLRGFLKVDGERPYQFGLTDAQRLALFARQVAIALQNVELFENLEQKVRERTAELQAQLARLQAVLESTSDGIIVTDRQGEILTLNPVARSWLEQTLSADEAARLRQVIGDLAAQAEQRPEREVQFRTFSLQLMAAPIVGYEGGTDRAVVAIHDLTYLKMLDRMKSDFVTNVSHELRSPITTIKLNASLMHRNPARWQQYLAPLSTEVDRLMRLVENVLQAFRLESGRLEKQARPTPLNTLVMMVVEGQQILASTQKLNLSYHPASTELLVLVDPAQITQALNNLVENALRYTVVGQVTVVVGSAEYAGQRWATVAVSDTGIGIPEEDLPHIFDRFYRGQAVRHGQIPGSGLGLAIVREFVELNGGRVTVESKVGVGSTFTLWLPLASGAGGGL